MPITPQGREAEAETKTWKVRERAGAQLTSEPAPVGMAVLVGELPALARMR